MRAYISDKKKGVYLSRPRFLALSEFGPRNVIYHEGQKYRVYKSLIPIQRQENPFIRAKLCKRCGAFHMLDVENADTCEHCGMQLDAENSEFMQKLFEITPVDTQKWERINSNEEERLRKGFQITTHFRFSRKEGKENVIPAQSENRNGTTLLEMRYGPAADLWRINRKWKRKKEVGFTLNLNMGLWGKDPEEAEDTALNTGNQGNQWPVFPFARDVRNILLIRSGQSNPLDEARLTNLQHALHKAMCAVFQVNESEIHSERLGEDSERSILLWEAAEGGVGVLRENRGGSRHLGSNRQKCPGNMPFQSGNGEDLLPEDQCAKACYYCLMAYRNQGDHASLDRHQIRDLLMELSQSRTLKGQQQYTYDEQYAHLRRCTDARSKLEKDFLDCLYRERRRLPDEAQKQLSDYFSVPDFFYEKGYVCVFCDGSVHDDPIQKEKDAQIRPKLEDGGFGVIVTRYDRPLEEQILENQDVFGKTGE